MDGCCSRDCGSCSDRIVCRCLQMTESVLVGALATLELRTLKDVRRETGAGDGCTACHARLRQLLEQHAYASSSAVPICSVR
jgi:bacterioferritin-associated ferredoxin